MKSYQICICSALLLSITGQASADWLGRYIPPGSTDTSLKNQYETLADVTLSDVTLGSGSVVQDPNFGVVEDPGTVVKLSGSYIRYNYTYDGGNKTYTGDSQLSQTSATAFSLTMAKSVENNPKVQADKLSFSVVQYAYQAQNVNPLTRAITVGNVSAPSLVFILKITLTDAMGGAIGSPIEIKSYTTSGYNPNLRYISDLRGHPTRITFDLAEQLKGIDYTNARFDLMMQAGSNSSDVPVNGSVFLSNITLEGTTPEPGSVVLTLIGCVPMLLRRRR